MSRYFGLILVLVFVAWQVVTAIISQINANKQQQQAEEIAKHRRQSGGGTPVGQGDGSGGTSRVDDLAARRKAQLEELRRRREAGRSAPTTPQARIGGPASGTPIETRLPDPERRSQPIQIEPVGRERKTDPWQARQDAQRRERETKLDKAKRASQVRATQQARTQKLAAEERMAVQQRADTRAVSSARADAVEAADALKAAEPSLIRSRIHSPQELRELFVLKELLDPPLALRRVQG